MHTMNHTDNSVLLVYATAVAFVQRKALGESCTRLLGNHTRSSVEQCQPKVFKGLAFRARTVRLRVRR